MHDAGAGVKVMTQNSHTVLVESNAGAGSGFENEAYYAAGAEIVATPEEIFTRALIGRKSVRIAHETVQKPNGRLPLLTPIGEVAGPVAIHGGASIWRWLNGGTAFSWGTGGSRSPHGAHPGGRRSFGPGNQDAKEHYPGNAREHEARGGTGRCCHRQFLN